MSEATTLDSVQAAGGPIEEAVAIFMLHPQTFEKSTKQGYPHPFAGYFAGRAGVLGEAEASTVNSAFAVFEPNAVKMFWDQGRAVHGAAGGAKLYSEQVVEFAAAYLSGADGLDRIGELGEKIIQSAPDSGIPVFAGWRAMPLPEDAPGRALQVMFVLRELRAGIHFQALALSGVSPVEAHMLNKGAEYCKIFGWAEPFADGADKKERYEQASEATDRRMAEIVGAALTIEEAAELARLSVAALATMKAALPPEE